MQGAERSSSLTGLQAELKTKAFITPELCCKSKEKHLPCRLQSLLLFGGCQICCAGDGLSPSDIGLIRKLLVAGRSPQLPKYQLRVFTENSSERFGRFPLLLLQVREDWK